MVKSIIYTPLFIFLLSTTLFTQPKDPNLRFEDKVRIVEAYKIAEKSADSIWAGWSETPFVILLVADEYEYLIGHTPSTDDFIPLGYDEILKQDVYYRERVFNTGLLATFPAIDGVPTIVIGLPENTGLNSVGWTVTLLHEHFHQMQMSMPDYFSSVETLNLSKGDESGMWMINFPFPYDSKEAGEQIAVVNGLLNELIVEYNEDKFNRFLSERAKLKDIFGEENYKYFSFQIWQEGLARYTEMKLMEMLNEGYTPTKAFQNLSDYQDVGEVIIYAFKELQKTLNSAKLDEYERVLFYSIGAGEGLLLDKVNPDWKKKYFTEKFYIENYY
jgi:hypothetical protein